MTYFPILQNKPVIYKKGCNWYCKSSNCSFEGTGESPAKAFQGFMKIMCSRY